MLKVYYGCMCSEKSGDMLKRALEAEVFQKKKILFLKPSVDDRFGEEVVQSRTGLKAIAHNLPCDLGETWEHLRKSAVLAGENVDGYDIFAFDEGQFFSKEIVSIIKYLVSKGKDVMVAALNLDFRGKPIGYTGELLLNADEVIHKKAYCSVCGKPALYSQRLVDGKPYTAGEGNVFIGDSEYEPRCRAHFIGGAE